MERAFQLPDKNFHICWTMDCESCHPNINDAELGKNAVRGFTQVLNELNWKATLFAIPEELSPLREVFKDAAGGGHELALHLHPQAAGEKSDYLGTFSPEKQAQIIRQGMVKFQALLQVEPTTCRPGYGSANDATFGVMAECGIRQASASFPGRTMSQLASNWGGAPLFAHYTHPYNRLLAGSMDFVEIPISVDWESMIWGGCHPQDLRVEYTDAKNHSFLIRKIMQRQMRENQPFLALVILTHNLFRYEDRENFRRETMLGMIDTIRKCAQELNVEIVGSTISQAAEAYRAVTPLQS
jgi:peptidoglycan/xylan/chitin deacetylase (PgdA/CDA1 family)